MHRSPHCATLYTADSKYLGGFSTLRARVSKAPERSFRIGEEWTPGVYRYSARGIRVTRALQILSESYPSHPSFLTTHLSFFLPSFLLSAGSGAISSTSRSTTLFVRRKREGRAAIRHRAAQCTLGFPFGAVSARRLLYKRAEIPSPYPRALRRCLSAKWTRYRSYLTYSFRLSSAERYRVPYR